MAKRYIQVGGDGGPADEITGTVVGQLPPRDIWPEGRIYVEWTGRGDLPSEGTYDAATGTVTPPTRVKAITRGAVLDTLSAAQWREMQRFGVNATGNAGSGVAYNDADVCKAIDTFNAERAWRLDDPRLASILAMLVTKGVLSAQDVTALRAALAAAAR